LACRIGLAVVRCGVSVAEWAPGPDLPERVELVRAALPDADRARFEQDLDQALHTARSNRELGRSVTSSRGGGGWCSSAGAAVGGGR
jgi:hypothetical protein